MPWMKWLPWRFLIRRLAQAHGFIDPMMVLARLHRFGQPAEVTEPIELLRSGVVFHARGLINSRIIQHNLDWLWPYWVGRQFDPADPAFVPRAFSITHINLTHRNWTAVGWPDCDELPIVDPRGLLTPWHDGWSIDGWVITDDGRRLFPARATDSQQRLEFDEGLSVVTDTRLDGLSLRSRATVRPVDGIPTCHLDFTAISDQPGWLAIALRPYNPEGVSFIHRITLDEFRHSWRVDDSERIDFTEPVERHQISDYHAGDVSQLLHDSEESETGECSLGMATAAALYRLKPAQSRQIGVRIPLSTSRTDGYGWRDALAGQCRISTADDRVNFLYEAAVRSLVLHSPGDVYPGPSTYKRFWFRDAAFIIHALMCAGLMDRAERAIDRFPARQSNRGYFHSQEGEWDSNGQALWTMQRFCDMNDCAPKAAWTSSIASGARWIVGKRVSEKLDVAHAGLLPAGFSAEHLGPNDCYYWDDFWGVAGLEAASELCTRGGDVERGHEFSAEAEAFRSAVDRNLAQAARRLGRIAMPASPYRRMDAGAIGSIVAGYPLQLCRPDDPWLLGTVDYLMEKCFHRGGFFQDMIHSGINPYLTLHIAQVLLRAGDARCHDLISTVADLASPTGQWPEAIHPRTLGGCMGDGQHVWAAAEWLLMIRNCFVREEGDSLILGSGVTEDWLRDGGTVQFGPAPTSFGPVTIEIESSGTGSSRKVRVTWDGDWHLAPERIDIRLPGMQRTCASLNEETATLQLAGNA